MPTPIGIFPPNLATDEEGNPIAAPKNVLLTFPGTLSAGTAVNIQDGTYSGGGPATVVGDTITLPATGAEFVTQDVVVAWNGQGLARGSMLGQGEVQWISQTQVAFAFNVLAGNQISIQVV